MARRAFCILVSALAATVSASAVARAQTVPFRGRVVMPAGGPPFRQMKIRVGAFGVTSPNDGGFFSSAVPAGTTSVTLQIETGNSRWIVRYPVGSVAVPRDASFVTDVIIGPSIEETLSRDYAAETARLRTSLKSAGVADSQVMAAIDGLRREFADRTNVQIDELRRAEQRGNERAQVFPRLAATIEAFAIKANNVEIAFHYLLEPSFVSDSAFAQLKRGITEYNVAFETLKTERGGFEKAVSDYWGNERISADLSALLDYALGEIHAVNILPLNLVVPDVSRILRHEFSGRDAADKRGAVLGSVSTSIVALRVRLEEFDRRKLRVLGALEHF